MFIIIHTIDTSLITRHQSMLSHLLRHILERIGQVLRAERQLAGGPDLGVLFLLAFVFKKRR